VICLSQEITEILKGIPDETGVYLMKDKEDVVIYVGKALSLKKRVKQYFQSKHIYSPKTQVLVKNIADIEYIVTSSEVEALILEANLIKKHRPKYNVRLKDDKRYPFVKITTNTQYPRIYLTRRKFNDGSLYFGPYTNVFPIRKTLDILSRTFGIRRCKKKVTSFGWNARPCLNYHIERCLGPCTGNIDPIKYNEMVSEVINLFKGDASGLVSRLKEKMNLYASELNYEAAASIRDDIRTIEEISHQHVSTSGWDDRDVIAGVAESENIYIQLFYVRDGIIAGKADFGLTSSGNNEFDGETLAEFIKQYYQDSPVPNEILVSHEIPDNELIQKWLSQKSRKDVKINVPVKGEKKKLVELAEKNAKMYVNHEKISRATPDKRVNEAIDDLAQKLQLPKKPFYIEGIDISNISGTDPVGSVVVFQGGLPVNQEYRQYNIKKVKGPNDIAMIGEVVHRRYSKLMHENKVLPDLVLIDGGEGQVNSAEKEMEDIGLNIPIIGLAKKFETIVFPGDIPPLILDKTSPSLNLLMRIRDEAHRFAVSSHRRKRAAKLTNSRLDSIPGIGKSRKKALLEHFKSVEMIEKSSADEISQINGISKNLAQKIIEQLKE